MRKFISLLTAIALSSLSTNQIIACTNPFLDPTILRVTIVTDGHTITDNSFNQSSYEGALQFKDEFSKWVKSGAAPADLAKKHVVITAAQPPTVDLNTLVQAYKNSFFMNSEVTVASGFIQKSALVKAQNQDLKGRMRYIYVDGDTETKLVPENKDLAGLLYEAEQSGFMAAIAACCFLVAHAADYGGINNLKVATYGGQDIPGVTNYMYGFHWAIKLFNAVSDNPKFASFKTELIEWIKMLKGSDYAGPLPKIFDLTNGTDGFLNNAPYTGNFNQSSTGSIAVNDLLASNGAKAIFGVSGPQTADTLSALAKYGNGKVIGVDTDQRKQYPQSADRFITSALKNIKDSVATTLWKAINRNPQTHKETDYSATFHDDATPQGGAGFTGIANNSAITAIYDSLNNPNNEINKSGGLFTQVSQGWQKVLIASENTKEYWINTLKIDPFGL